MFIDTKESKEAYKTLRELYQGDNRDVARVNVILSSFESQGSTGGPWLYH